MSTTMVEREIKSQMYENLTLQNELTWGTSRRILKKMNTTASPLTIKRSPLNVPFIICRTSQKKKKKPRCNCVSRSAPQLSLLDRSVLSQTKYMELLSIPNYPPNQGCSISCGKKIKKKTCCHLEPCPPRIIQMSVPNKRLVLENWKAYQNVLPTEILMRFDKILKSGGNLEPSEARYYFKKLKIKERRALRRQKLLCKKIKNAEKRGEELWLRNEINGLADAIVNYIKNEPIYILNFQQMMTSNEILNYLADQRVVKVRSRNTRCVYKKSVIEICDKVVKWMDTMSFFTDIQPVDSKELILAVPSLEGMLQAESEGDKEEEEEEAEEEEEREEDFKKRRKSREEELEESTEGTEGFEGGDEGRFEEFLAHRLLDNAKMFAEEGEGSFFDLLEGLDEDVFEKLIQILSVSPEEFLLDEIDNENLPGVTYGDVLQKLNEMRDGSLQQIKQDKIFLEEKMVEWAKTNDPESVDDKVLNKIHETSKMLADLFKTVDINELRKKGKGEGDEDTTEDDQFGVAPLIEEDEEEEGEGEEFKEALGEKEIEGGQEFDQDTQEGKSGEGESGEEAGGEGESGEEESGEGAGAEEESAEGEGVEMVEGAGMEGEGFEFGYVEGEEGMFEGMRREDFEEGEELTEEELRRMAELEAERLRKEAEELGEVEGLEEGEELVAGKKEISGKLAGEFEKLDSLLGIIKGHKPPKVYEHEPGTICCLSLKIWAVWLLEIANNAHKWTQWISEIIKQVRHYAAVIRGDVVLPNGEKKVLYKEEWRKFVTDTEEKVIGWRQYSKHVKDLSSEIMENFHGKQVRCCPKCLQDHLIKNVVTAHETLQALTEAINCAGYWQRCLDKIIEQTSKITEIEASRPTSTADVTSLASDESYLIEIEELSSPDQLGKSEESLYEIEEIALPRVVSSDYLIEEILPSTRILQMHEIQEMAAHSNQKQTKEDTVKHPGDGKRTKNKKR